MTELTIVMFNAVAAGLAAYQIIYSGIKDIYRGGKNG